jgi:hypothetical protein
MEQGLVRNHRKYDNIFKTAHENIEYAGVNLGCETMTFFLYAISSAGERTGEYKKLILGDFISISDEGQSSRAWRVFSASVNIKDESDQGSEDKVDDNDESSFRVVLKIPMLAEADCLSVPMDVRNELWNTTRVVNPQAYHQVLAIAVTKCVHVADKYILKIFMLANKEDVGSNEFVMIKFRPSYGFVITEALDGDLNNSVCAKHLSYSKPRKRKNGIEYTLQETKQMLMTKGTMWGLMNLTKELFYQSHIFRRKDLVHCNLHEDNVRFKTNTLALVETIQGEKTAVVPRFHTHICGFKNLRAITTRSEVAFVDTFGSHCRYVPHYAKDNARDDRHVASPQMLTAFGVGTIVYRFLLRMADEAATRSCKKRHAALLELIHTHLGLDSNQAQGYAHPLTQPNRAEVATMLTNITKDLQISILEDEDMQTNFINFIACCVSGELDADVFETLGMLSSPNHFVGDFVTNVFSNFPAISKTAETLMERASKWKDSETEPLFNILEDVQPEILMQATTSFGSLMKLTQIWRMEVLKKVPFQITITESLCETPHKKKHSHHKHNSDVLDSQDVFTNLKRFSSLNSLHLNGGGCLLNLLALGELKTLETLHLIKFTNLTILPLQNFPNLISLSVKRCEHAVLENISSCTNLQKLRLINLPMVKVLPIGTLVRLQELTIRKMSPLLVEITGLSNCTKLTKVKIFHLDSVRILTFANLGNLTHLCINTCPLLVTIDLKNCTQLVALGLEHMNVIEFLSLENNVNLQQLTICRTPRLLTNITGFTDCTELTHVVLMGLEGVRTLSLGKFQNLQELVVVDCPLLAEIIGLSNCTNLNFLMLEKCGSLTGVEGIDQCIHLEHVLLKDTHVVETLSFLNLSSLTRLRLVGLSKLVSIAGLEDCTSLNEIDLENLSMITSLSLSTCLNLLTISLTEMLNIKELSFTNLHRLEIVNLESMPLLVEITGFETCTELQYLHMKNLNLCHQISLCGLLKPEHITIEKCPKISLKILL